MRLLGVCMHYENDVNPEGVSLPADDNREDEECSASAL